MWLQGRDWSLTGRSQDNAPGDLTSWRQRQLLRAGFDTDLASCLAADRAIDLHALIELVERGCPPRLAARILAPLDREEPSC